MTAAPEEVWSALVENRDRAVRVARARCGTRDEVDDCVQEAMARVAGMQNVDVSRVGPLLTSVVSNLAVDGHRSRGMAVRHQHRVLQPPAPLPEDEICEAAEAWWLWAQRRTLPEQDRRAFELRAHGRTIGEIALELGITYKAAEHAVGRARGRIRNAWRATAALLGILWGARPRKVPAAAQVALASVTAIAVAAGIGVIASTQARPQRGDAAQLREFALAAPAVLARGRAEPAAAPPGAARRKHPPARPAVGASDPPLATTAPVRAGKLTVDPVPVRRRRGDETALETAEDCLRRGLVITTTYVGCPR